MINPIEEESDGSNIFAKAAGSEDRSPEASVDDNNVDVLDAPENLEEAEAAENDDSTEDEASTSPSLGDEDADGRDEEDTTTSDDEGNE